MIIVGAVLGLVLLASLALNIYLVRALSRAAALIDEIERLGRIVRGEATDADRVEVFLAQSRKP